MNNLMEYKGYHGDVEYSAEDGCFIGKVVGIKAFIIYDGKSVEELEKAFHTSIDDYLIICEECGDEPDKEYSGQFTLRIPPELHRELDIIAASKGTTLTGIANQFLAECCARTLKSA